MIRKLLQNLPFFFILCLLGSGVTVRAQTARPPACPAAFPLVASADPQARVLEIARLQPHAAACLQRPDYYAYLGQLLLLQERYPDALEALERSLLLDGSQLDVQLDYVLGLAKTGDQPSARALARQVLERPDAPVAIREAMQTVLRDEQQAAKNTQIWQWRGSAQTMLGLDNNLNSATSADAINLTLPNGNVSLLLDASSKPKSGLASLNAGHVMAQTHIDSGLLVVQGDWRERLAPGHSTYAYSQQDVSALYKPNNTQTWVKRVALSSFSMGGSNLFTGITTSAWQEHEAGSLMQTLVSCTIRSGLEAERRTYAQDSMQNGVYGSAFGAFNCQQGQSQYQFALQTGRDWASNGTRAGGSQTRIDLKTSWDRHWGWARTTAEWLVSRLQDQRPYSELLGGVTRSTLRQNLRISVIKRLNSQENPNLWGGMYWVNTFEMLRHNSNLDLFDVNGKSLYTGLRYEF